MRKLSAAVGMDEPEREDRSKVKSAFDPEHDPTCYGMYEDPASERQAVYDGNSFADMRDDMNRRRERTARAMGRRYY